MLEMSEKELGGQSELPRQEKGEDRKEHKEGAGMNDRANGYVEKQESQGALAFTSQTTRCEGKEEGSKDRNQMMLRMDGKG